MSSIDRQLLKLIRRIKDRVHMGILFKYMLMGAGIGAVAGIVLAAASRFAPIYAPYWKALLLIVTAIVCAFLYGAFKTPDTVSAALKADSMGLKERTVTALGLIGIQNAFAEMEKRDALLHLQDFDYKKRISILPDRKNILVCAILIAVLALSGFVPNPMEQRAAELHREKSRIAEQKAEIKKIADKVEANPKLTVEQKKEIEKKLEELRKEISSANNSKDRDKALQKAEKKLQLLRNEYVNDDLKKLSDTLAGNQATKALADLIKSGDEKKLKQAVRDMAETLKKLDDSQIKQLAEDMKQLAKELKDNPQLAQALSRLSDKLAGGDLGNLSAELDQLSQSISQLMQNEDFRDALSQVQEQLQNLQANNSSGQQGQNGQDASGTQSQGNSQGQNQGQNQGSQQGQQNSQGKGQGGGAGKGTDMGQEDQTPSGYGSSGINKKDGSESKTGEYESVYTPKTLGGQGETSNLTGKKGSGGNTEQVTTDGSNAGRGSAVPYNQVIGEYKQQALDGMDGSEVPPGMQDMVRDYFSNLEE